MHLCTNHSESSEDGSSRNLRAHTAHLPWPADSKDVHPRQAAWSAQFILENFTPFNSQEEWDAFNKLPKNGGQNLGKLTPADVGIDVKYVTWAKAQWAKYGRIKTHILNVVNVDFRAFLTNGRLKSGQQTSAVVELLRRKGLSSSCSRRARCRRQPPVCVATGACKARTEITSIRRHPDRVGILKIQS